MTKEQLALVQRVFGVFRWDEVIEIEGDSIFIANGLLRIREVWVSKPLLKTSFKLEINETVPSPTEEFDYTDEWHEVAEGLIFAEILIQAISAYAGYKATGIIDQAATEARVKEYDQQHESEEA